jgi:hypothetical protein
MRSRRSSMRAKCSLILCLNSCSGIASPGSPGSPARSSKPPPRSRSCCSPRPPRPCPPPLACLSLSLPTWPSSFSSSTSWAPISLGRVRTRKRPKVGSDKSSPSYRARAIHTAEYGPRTGEVRRTPQGRTAEAPLLRVEQITLTWADGARAAHSWPWSARAKCGVPPAPHYHGVRSAKSAGSEGMARDSESFITGSRQPK